MPDLSKSEVLRRYREAASASEPFEKARWGSAESMNNRFQTVLDAISFDEVTQWLDVGSGLGALQQTMRPVDVKTLVTADIVYELVAQAKSEKTQLLRVQADVESLPFTNGSFDLVTAVGLIHCSGVEPRRTISELVRCITPGGQLVITAMNKDWKGFRLPENEPNPEHLWFGIDEIEQLLIEAGVVQRKLRGLLPRTGEIGRPEDGYDLVVSGRRSF